MTLVRRIRGIDFRVHLPLPRPPPFVDKFEGVYLPHDPVSRLEGPWGNEPSVVYVWTRGL